MTTALIKGKIPSVYIQRLAPTLKELKRGGTLSDNRILEIVPELASTQTKARYLDSLLRKWFMRERGIRIERRHNSGYYLLTDAEQAKRPSIASKLARRRYAAGLAEGQAVDPNQLENGQRRKLEYALRVIATQLQLATEAMNKIRWSLDQTNVARRRPSIPAVIEEQPELGPLAWPNRPR